MKHLFRTSLTSILFTALLAFAAAPAVAQQQKAHSRPVTQADIPDQSDAEAKKILDKASAKYRTNPMKVEFKIVMNDTKTGKKQTTNGNVIIKGNKFVLSVPEAQTYFNGKEEWIYVASNNEVTVTYPTQKELQELNPTYILNSYLGNSTVQFSRDNKKTDAFYTIDVFPAYRDHKAYYKATIKVNRKNSDIISINVLNRNGVHANFSVLSAVQRKYDDAFFTFYPKSHPGVTINDMR